MPATEPLPTVTELVRAYHTGAKSQRQFEDSHDGSLHDICAGAGALLWRRAAEHDRDEFRRIYFDTAPRGALDEYIERRYGVERIQDQPGSGTAYLSRATTTAGAGIFYAGTRIQVNVTGGDAVRLYEVAEDTPAAGGDTAVAVPVNALKFEDNLVDVSTGQVTVLELADPTWDATWQVTRLAVSPGTVGEKDEEYRARARATRIASRVGYPDLIRSAMQAAGASTVALFQSDFLGDALDFGFNRIYVADEAFETSASLLRAARLAAPAVVVAGASNQVLPMTKQPLSLTVTVRMFDRPEKFDQVATAERAGGAIYEYFRTRDNPFLWRKSGVRGAIYRSVPNSQSAEVDSSLPEPDLATLFDSTPLPRYTVERWAISVVLQGPSA